MRLVVRAASRPLPPIVCRFAPSPAVMLSCCTTTTAPATSGFSYKTFVLPRPTSAPLFIDHLSLQTYVEHAGRVFGRAECAQGCRKRPRPFCGETDMPLHLHQLGQFFFG